MNKFRSQKMSRLKERSPSEKMKEAARELECGEDEVWWDERLRKVANQKPEPEKPE
jgi:hypothetical protein